MKDWYSASIEPHCIGDDKIIFDVSKSVWIFKADDFDRAFDISINIGYKQEQSYVSGVGLVVHWRFIRVSSLDLFHFRSNSPVEVHHQFDSQLKGTKLVDYPDPRSYRPDLE